MAKLSVVIPSRDERFLIPTIDDIFRNAAGEIEVVAVLDSDKWPSDWKSVTDRHPNLHTIHNGKSIGMRGSINKGVASAISRGAKFIAKSDGHCAFDEGFDEKLKADMADDWIVIPRRKRLDPESWTLTETHKPDIDYHFLSFPDDPNDFGGPGLNGKPWLERAAERFGKPEYDLDDEMSSQGSFWACRADYFQRMGFMDEASYGPFWNEMQELALCCWLSGGQVKVNKKTWYAHLHKGKKYGRGYHLPESWLQKGRNHTMLWPWNEAWPKQTLPFEWLIDHFWPVPSWPENWREVLYATRKPRAILNGVGVMGDTDSMDCDNNLPNFGQLATGSPSLRIHKAHYGIGSLEDIDVRDHLQSLIKDNSLDIIVNNSTLTPNSNPFRGKKKQLNVTYSLDGGEVVTITREEKDWLIIGQGIKAEAERFIAALDDKAMPKLMDDNFLKVGSEETARFISKRDGREDDIQPAVKITTADGGVQVVHPSALNHRWNIPEPPKLIDPPRTPAALNDYLIRKFNISPQRLRGPMPIELRDFHRNDLAQLFAELGFKRGAEIGVAEGNYSEVLLKANPECELFLVDPWHHYSANPQGKSKDKHEYAYNETKRKTANYPNVKLLAVPSMTAVQTFDDDELQFCYIDGNHLFDFVMQDLIEWSKRVRSGGIVSGDDYYNLDQRRWTGGGVVEAVQAYTNAHRIPIWYIFQGHKSVDYLWVKP